MPRPPDLAEILNAIRERPDDGNRCFDFASWLWNNGRDDTAVAVRVLWPTLRDALVYVSLEDMARKARRLAKLARNIEGRADDTPRE
jgi:hypothetical protein